MNIITLLLLFCIFFSLLGFLVTWIVHFWGICANKSVKRNSKFLIWVPTVFMGLSAISAFCLSFLLTRYNPEHTDLKNTAIEKGDLFLWNSSVTQTATFSDNAKSEPEQLVAATTNSCKAFEKTFSFSDSILKTIETCVKISSKFCEYYLCIRPAASGNNPQTFGERVYNFFEHYLCIRPAASGNNPQTFGEHVYNFFDECYMSLPLYVRLDLITIRTYIFFPLEYFFCIRPWPYWERDNAYFGEMIYHQIEFHFFIRPPFEKGFPLTFGEWFYELGETAQTLTNFFTEEIFVFCKNLIQFGNIYWTPIRYLDLGTWIQSGLLEVRWEFYFDNLTLIMLLVVNSISFLVHLYSIDYMSHDPNQIKFMSYLSLFTFFMLLLITGDNFIILFLGWEGVGLCSYLLISFWYTRVQANKSAMKALIVNRISDFALTIGLVSIYFVFRSFNFGVVFAMAPLFENKTFFFMGSEFYILPTIATLLFIGACGKSAQIGLHTWLPDAMEGPTPVSALIHAATMVTAGVFLIIKCSPIFEYAPSILSIVTVVGALTAFFAASAGLVQNDLKKVIAYSTCSQLGYMIFACGLSNYHVGFFHLVNHAFFKALLFLSAGAIIHSLSNEQDMRKYGGLLTILPFTSVMLLIGSLSLMGLPFLTGFYSKDLILEIAYSKYTVTGHFAYWLGLVTAAFTSFYSYRVFYFTFLYKNNSFKKVAEHIHELPVFMATALFALAVGSIFLGYISKDLFVGLGTDFWNESIFILPEHNNQIEAEFIPHHYKILPFFCTMLSIMLANFFFEFNIQWTKKNNYDLKKIYNFFVYKWYFDMIYNHYINKPLLKYAYSKIFRFIDKGVLELIGPFGLSHILLKMASNSKIEYDGLPPKQGGAIFFFCVILFFLFHFFF